MIPFANLAMSVLISGSIVEAHIGLDPVKPPTPVPVTSPQRPDSMRQQVLTRLEKQLASAALENQKGLLSPRFATANAHFRSAIRQLEALRHKVAVVAKADQPDGAQLERLSALGHRVTDTLVSTLLNAGSEALVCGQLGKALADVNHALALDPGNEDARAMRVRVEVVANEPVTVAGIPGLVHSPALGAAGSRSPRG